MNNDDGDDGSPEISGADEESCQQLTASVISFCQHIFSSSFSFFFRCECFHLYLWFGEQELNDDNDDGKSNDCT